MAYTVLQSFLSDDPRPEAFEGKVVYVDDDGNVFIQTSTGIITTAGSPKEVTTFAQAKTLVKPGIRRFFLVTNNELYGSPTHSTFTGTSWYHSPTLLQNE